MLPYALSIGMTEYEFWHSNPKKMKAHTKGHTLKMHEKDYSMWIMGQYVLNAVSVAVEHNLAGKKAKSKYADKPLMHEQFEYIGLSEDEIAEKKIQKEIEKERAFALSQSGNLPLPFADKQKNREDIS